MAYRGDVIMETPTAALASLGLAIVCCASLPSLADTGIVVDKDTGNPIPNAVVLAQWTGVIRTFTEARSKCFKAEVTQSDASGRFSFSSFSWNLNPVLMDRSRTIAALAPGYHLSPQADINGPRIALERQSGTSAEQIKSLGGAAIACDGAKSVVLPYLKELYAEASAIATTREDKLKAAYVLFEIETIELGQDRALVRDAERVQKIKEGS
jgi:hypothetical protein